jgi:acyl carrier protein
MCFLLAALQSSFIDGSMTTETLPQTTAEAELASLIVSTLNLEVSAAEIDPEAPLYGEGLGLDSIDMLEISLVVAQRYDVKLRADDEDNQSIFKSLRSLSAYIQAAQAPFRAVLLIVLVPLLFHASIIATSHTRFAFTPGGLFKVSFVTASALMHWGLYASLLASFALTLRRGHTPLITAMAYKLHGAGIPTELVVYTRRVTIAWSCFFAAQLSTSVLLFCFAPLTAWSLFVNVLDIPLVVAMYAAEYAVRIRVLHDPPRHSFATIFEMVSGCMKSRSPAPSPD